MPSPPFPPSPSTQANRLWQLVVYVGEPHYFLICRTCRIALPLSRVASHFSSTGGHAYSRADCARLLAAWEAIFLPSYPIKLCNENDLANWSRPLTPTAPIPQLPVYYGLHCSYQDPATGQRCPTLYSNEKHIQRHCRKQHGWQNTRKRGRQRRSVAQKQEHHRPWEANVPCQRLTGKGTLWRVNLSTPCDQDGGEGEGRDKTQGIRATAATAADAWDELEAQLDRRVASQTATDPSLRYPVHLSPWLEKTGWTTHLHDHDLWTVAELLVLLE
ncbi:hypothetical protein DM02DRAFT_678251 [Periconia macrospinosa]|uniref:Uncharacterized protein n=1 Tax=Periconia macrospinosa TaxID=97972 RepID=A0A2V1D0S7_9PLEO|nr:hypothetical protein DM02DRAFT_678251 [Periconia macrospinosa]